MKPVVLTRNKFPKPVEARLAEEFQIMHVLPGEEERLADPAAIEAVATNGYAKADGSFMARFPNLKLIASMSVGTDHIDLRQAGERRIAVTNIIDVHNHCVADLGLGLIVAAARNIVFGDRYVRAGKWVVGPAPLGMKLGGKTLGILGLGKIGRLLASRAEAVGLKIAYCNRRKVEGVSYTYIADPIGLAEQADIFAVIIPANPQTENIVSDRLLAALGPAGFLINLARGSLVDDAALIFALKERRIAGAALDVFRNEPHVRNEYLELDNVVLTPHLGSATSETRVAMGMAMLQNLIAYFAGERPPNLVPLK